MSLPSWSNVPNAWGLATFGGYMYVANFDAGTISKIDASTGSVVNSSWATEIADIFDIEIDDTGTAYMYALSFYSGTIVKINMSTGSVVNANWTSGLTNPTGLIIDATGTYMYASNNVLGTIIKIDRSNGSIVNDTWISGLDGPVDFALDATGTYMYVTCMNSSTICKIDVQAGSIVNSSWATGLHSPDRLSINEAGTYMYVTNSGAGTISKINMTNGSVVNASYISGLTEPGQLIIIGNYIYVVDYATGNIGKYFIPSQPVPCFKQDTKILTHKGYRLIQDLRKGDLVKTLKHGYKQIDLIGTTTIEHAALSDRIKNQLYQCSKSEFPDLFEPLVITGCHSILVDEFKSKHEEMKTIEILGKICSTEQKICLPACADLRASVYEIPGTYNIYHLALENDISYMNYGIYANGLLVESCSKKILKKNRKMKII
jgi:hypothetical protein